jgi:hypothetical protein
MALTLTVGTTVLTLPGGLQWTDRAWSPVEQEVRVLRGGPVLRRASARGGRPITLESGADSAYLSEAQRAQLMTWAATPGQQLTLAGLRGGAARTVILRHQDGALELTPVDNDNEGHAAQYWRAIIRLQEIA